MLGARLPSALARRRSKSGGRSGTALSSPPGAADIHMTALSRTSDEALEAARASAELELERSGIVLGAEPLRATDPDLLLPPIPSLVITLLANLLMQITFFIAVPSADLYSKHLGGTSVFSGLIIGIPPAVGMLCIAPLGWWDQGLYWRPINVACASLMLGNMLYALAFRANWLYMILIGRMVTGVGFTYFMYAKRYCSDPRIVGIRRRTTLAGWQVLGQGVGFSLGPFAGGLLSKISLRNKVFNGYTAPGWLMAACWALFWVAVHVYFEDVPADATFAQGIMHVHDASAADAKPLAAPTAAPADGTSAADAEVSKTIDADTVSLALPTPASTVFPTPTGTAASSTALLVPAGTQMTSASAAASASALPSPPPSPSAAQFEFRMSKGQWGVTATMMWFSMTNFFILGAWESNIPVFTSSDAPANPFDFSPFAAGNLIALGGACAIPFLLVNLFFARRVQDRHTLALGTTIGLVGLLLAMGILAGKKVSYGTLFLVWFLVALGFNIATTVTLALLSKQLPGEWNARTSIMIQCSNYTGRVTGAVWGGAGVDVGMLAFVGLQVGIVAVGTVMFLTLWKELKAKTG